MLIVPDDIPNVNLAYCAVILQKCIMDCFHNNDHDAICK